MLMAPSEPPVLKAIALPLKQIRGITSPDLFCNAQSTIAVSTRMLKRPRVNGRDEG